MKQQKTISSSSSSSTLCTVHYLLLCLISISTVSARILHSNETDRIALLDFKHRIYGDPHGALHSSWNESQVHHCSWQGVSCGRQHRRVVALRLPEKGLVGTISPQIGNLTFLRNLDLSSNGLHGQIPGELGGLFRLRYLNLSANALTGDLTAVNLTHCLQLRKLNISQNGLRGVLPISLSKLQKLQSFSLGENQMTGEIPQAFGNLSSLQSLFLSDNHLHGSIPHELTQCQNLKSLSFTMNNLSGTISSSFFNMTSIKVFSISGNSLQGTIPSYMGDTMPNLEELYLAGNKFHGAIPISFPNASKLQNFEVSQNHFVGKVPDNIGKLKHLVYLNLESNLLGTTHHDESLAFMHSLSNCSNLQTFSITRNKLEGEFPKTICNFSSKLSYLGLGENRLFGTIPIGIKNLASLTALILTGNLLSGRIPSEIGCLKNLQGLGLDHNQFIGDIPSSLFNLTSLAFLYLDHNNLDGNIPSNVGNFLILYQFYLSNNKFNGTIPWQIFELPSLSVILDLSSNSFTGPLPITVGRLKTLNWLDISRNKLFGEIPKSLGDCLSLEYLDMHANFFEGKIPPSLASLKSIKHLDISNNKLTGEIPRELQKLPLLEYLNLSFNDLEGEVPTSGIFAMAKNISLLGNKKLCGGIPELKLQACPMKKRKHHRKHPNLVIIVVAACVFASFLAFLTLHYYKKDGKSKDEFSEQSNNIEKLSRISYSYLHRATQGFNETNFIGSGSFGSVYKGRFHQQGGEQVVAIKVLDLSKNGASKSFHAECKVLRNIRHRNLVSVLTCCSSCDFMGNEFKALVYKFMENGDLDTWLHSDSDVGGRNNNVLSVLQRLNITIDVASALQYLHNDCEPPIIHCDLKPSNILLDKELTAHVGDFGLSRLYSPTIEDSSQRSSTLGLKGSIGYIAPEYGTGGNPSICGDVYSYGIFLLEMFTAKRPTYNFSGDGCSSLCEYIEAALRDDVMRIVDPLLLACQESNHGIRWREHLDNNPGKLVEIEEHNKMDDFFISVFKIGLTCASRSPMDRARMKDVTRELHKIRKAFFV